MANMVTDLIVVNRELTPSGDVVGRPERSMQLQPSFSSYSFLHLLNFGR